MQNGQQLMTKAAQWRKEIAEHEADVQILLDNREPHDLDALAFINLEISPASAAYSILVLADADSFDSDEIREHFWNHFRKGE